MKAIILAAGQGTRLHPTTKVISKHLLPVYNYPMIYYPLWMVERCGAREILIITNKNDLRAYMHLLGNTFLRAKLYYAVQNQPQGIVDALFISEFFVRDQQFILALGDNLFYGRAFENLLRTAVTHEEGAAIFAFHSARPHLFGVLDVDENNNILRIVEKPIDRLSNWVVSGIYVLDKRALELAKQCRPSHRNELDMAEILNLYLGEGQLRAEFLKDDARWFDLGTPDGLLEASQFVQEKTRNGTRALY